MTECTLGDLSVHVRAKLPPLMWKALAAISVRAHAAYDECSGSPKASHDKCLFMSLAVRDFLVQVGFLDATVRGCLLLISADDLQGKIIWSVGVGVHDLHVPNRFNGHAVCTVPSLQLLIDTTLYQAQRTHWPELPGMMAVNYHEPWPKQMVYRRPSLCILEATSADRVVKIAWGDRPELEWRKSVDFRCKSQRRRFVTRAMLEAVTLHEAAADERGRSRAR